MALSLRIRTLIRERNTFSFIILLFSFTLFIFTIMNCRQTAFDLFAIRLNLINVAGHGKATPLVEISKTQLVDKLTCKFPILDPWDPTVLPYVTHNYGLVCNQLQPNVSYVDYFNYLWLNSTEYARMQNAFNGKVKCTFETFERANGTDDEALEFDPPLPITPEKPGPLHKDNVRVNCTISDSNKLVYFNLHPLAANRTDKSFGNETDDQLSVLMFLIDSMSLSVAQRNLPLTFKYLTEQMNVNIFHGYNKVADSSFVNLIPLLTGRRVFDAEPGMPTELEKGWGTRQFDDWPLIWKDYAKKGYVASFNEDSPQWGLFNFGTRGFAKKRVEHSYFPFWRTSHFDTNIQANSSEFCFGNQPKLWFQIDILRRQFLQYRGKLKFGYHFFAELIHHRPENGDRGDGIFRDFLQEMHESGYFNHTIMIFGSDHGHRFSTLRQTLAGLIEERMPMISIYFPPWFLKKHPNIENNLKINQYRLAANFDVHETLHDFLSAKFENEQRPLSSRGLSLLYEIPENRTCKSAGIPQHYCTCAESKAINVTDLLAHKAAQFLIKDFNLLCAQLSLKQLRRAELLEQNQQVVNAVLKHEEVKNMTLIEAEMKLVRVSLEVNPSDAIFETLLTFNTRSDIFTLPGGPSEISRLNLYGDQSACIPNSSPLHKKLCYCKQKQK